ncbi:MAG: hypothetical protein ACXV3F_05795 [Frankiaceae bacterium]
MAATLFRADPYDSFWLDGVEPELIFVALPVVGRSSLTPPLEDWLSGALPGPRWDAEYDHFVDFMANVVTGFLPWLFRACETLGPLQSVVRAGQPDEESSRAVLRRGSRGRAKGDAGYRTTLPNLTQLRMRLRSCYSAGELERHLRRMRLRYGQRRAALLAAVARRGVGVEGIVSLQGYTGDCPPGLVLGHAYMAEPAIERGVQLLAAAAAPGPRVSRRPSAAR